MPAFDLLHCTEPDHPLVSCLEPSDGRRTNNLYPLSFLFCKGAEHGITRRGEWYRRGLRRTCGRRGILRGWTSGFLSQTLALALQ